MELQSAFLFEYAEWQVELLRNPVVTFLSEPPRGRLFCAGLGLNPELHACILIYWIYLLFIVQAGIKL